MLLRILRDYESGKFAHLEKDERGDFDLDTTEERIASVKRRIADLEAKLAQHLLR